MPASDHRFGLILVGISSLSWSTAGLFTRAIDTDLFAMLFWRGIFATLGLLTVLILLRGPGSLRGFLHLGLWGWVYAASSAAALFCYIASFRMTSVAHVAIIYAIVVFAAVTWHIARQSRSATLLPVPPP